MSKVIPISGKLDAVTSWMIDNNVPLTLENWLELAYFGDVQSLSQLDAEAIAEIPNYLLPKKYRE